MGKVNSEGLSGSTGAVVPCRRGQRCDGNVSEGVTRTNPEGMKICVMGSKINY